MHGKFTNQLVCFAYQERWLEENAEYWMPQPSSTGYEAGSAAVRKTDSGKEQRFKKYMPFGDGMRACVGQSLAKMNYTAATALLLSHFTFRLADRVRGAALLSAHVISSMQLLPIIACTQELKLMYPCLGCIGQKQRLKAVCVDRWGDQRECSQERWHASLWLSAMACGCMQSPDL
jgi:hypothetical protein